MVGRRVSIGAAATTLLLIALLWEPALAATGTSLTLTTPPSSAAEGSIVTFKGCLSRIDTGARLSGAAIEIRDEDLLSSSDLMASGLTDSTGCYTISWTAKPMDLLDRTVEAFANFPAAGTYSGTRTSTSTIDIGSAAPTPTPSPTPPPCAIQTAQWSKSPASEGDPLTLSITTNQYCEGQSVTFAVYWGLFEDPLQLTNVGNGESTFIPITVKVTGSQASNTWKAKSGHYFFTAKIGTQEKKSGWLSVSAASPTPTPTPTPTTPSCTIQKAAWSKAPSTEGETVTLSATTNAYCEGQFVTFAVYWGLFEDPLQLTGVGNGESTFSPSTVKVTDSQASTIWKVKTGHYFFTAKTGTPEIKSGWLSVSAASPSPSSSPAPAAVATSVTLTSPPTSVAEGSIATFKGCLSRSDTGAKLSGNQIEIRDEDLLSSSDLMASGTTDSTGCYTIPWTAKPMDLLDRTVEAFANFPGTSSYSSSRSPVSTINIDPATSTPTPAQCAVQTTRWSKSPATEGETVTLTVSTNALCEGQQVNFTVYWGIVEDPLKLTGVGNKESTFTPSSIRVSGQWANTTWKTKSGVFFFTANLGGDETKSPWLSVSKASPGPIVPAKVANVSIAFSKAVYQVGDSAVITAKFYADGNLSDPTSYKITITKSTGTTDDTTCFTRITTGVYECKSTIGQEIGTRTFVVNATIGGLIARSTGGYTVGPKCEILNASWSKTLVVHNETVEIIVKTNEACNGKSARFEIWKDGFLGGDLYGRGQASVVGQETRGMWVAKYQAVVLGLPAYYFKVFIENETAASKADLNVKPAPKATLIVSANAYPAEVYINNELKGYFGAQPLEIALPPGTYALRVSRADFKDWQQSVQLVDGDKKEIKATLTAVSKVGVPPDTPCTSGWPSHQGSVIQINEPNNACDLFEVTDTRLLPIAQEAENACMSQCATPQAHAFCQQALQYSGLKSGLTSDRMKKCEALYIVNALGPARKFMQGYFEAERQCNPYGTGSCDAKTGNSNAFQLVCKGPVGRPHGWASDADMNKNSCIFSDLPAHASLNVISTGTCVDYSVALTTLLRLMGFSKNEVYSVTGPGHEFNLIKFPGDIKFTLVDTTGNFGAPYVPGSYPGSTYGYCNYYGASCANDNGQGACPAKSEVYGCSP